MDSLLSCALAGTKKFPLIEFKLIHSLNDLFHAIIFMAICNLFCALGDLIRLLILIKHLYLSGGVLGMDLGIDTLR